MKTSEELIKVKEIMRKGMQDSKDLTRKELKKKSASKILDKFIYYGDKSANDFMDPYY